METTRQRIAAAARVASGNFLEMYDFMVFGYYAEAIGQAYFPSRGPFISLMLALMTFGAGFLMRPLGAVILGGYIDRHGRRKGLLLTLTLMSIGTLSIAVMPTYAQIGWLAPFAVLIGRLLQGFSAGVELGGVSVYLHEIAPPSLRGFYVSFQSASQQVAVVAAALIGLAASQFFAHHNSGDGTTSQWAWRFPFLVGCLIVPFLFHMRQSLAETPEFAQRKEHPSISQMIQSLRDHWLLIVLGTMMVTLTTVGFYLITAYTPTFGSMALHLSKQENLIVTASIGAANFFWLPIMGYASDRIGRRPLLITFSAITLLTAYPALLWLTQEPSFARLLTTELWLSFLYSAYNGSMVVHLTEIMPKSVRTSGFSLAYSLATALFGGFTPAICTYLIHETNNEAMPGAWLSFAAIMGLTAALTLTNRFKAAD